MWRDGRSADLLPTALLANEGGRSICPSAAGDPARGRRHLNELGGSLVDAGMAIEPC
jgi:hypothetical protein